MELNADIGEGGLDARIVPHVHRVSIACGGHVGDRDSMLAALALADRFGARAGAHPSYPDPANFGRQNMEATPQDIRRWIVEQVAALKYLADEIGLSLFHVKPHGALYNRAAIDTVVGRAVIDAVSETGLALVALAGSPLVAMAKAEGLVVLEEAFADRRYLRNGQLAPRGQPGAVLDRADLVIEQAGAIALGLPVTTIDGGSLLLKADTLCLHGDGPGADKMVEAVRRVLDETCFT